MWRKRKGGGERYLLGNKINLQIYVHSYFAHYFFRFGVLFSSGASWIIFKSPAPVFPSHRWHATVTARELWKAVQGAH